MLHCCVYLTINKSSLSMSCHNSVSSFFFSDVNECIESTTQLCFNNGVCVNTNGSYQCNCTEQYTGPDCGDGESIPQISLVIGGTVKVLNFQMPKIFAVIILKFKLRGFSIEKFGQKVQVE